MQLKHDTAAFQRNQSVIKVSVLFDAHTESSAESRTSEQTQTALHYDTKANTRANK